MKESKAFVGFCEKTPDEYEVEVSTMVPYVQF